jgi:hypothetical protein
LIKIEDSNAQLRRLAAHKKPGFFAGDIGEKLLKDWYYLINKKGVELYDLKRAVEDIITDTEVEFYPFPQLSDVLKYAYPHKARRVADQNLIEIRRVDKIQENMTGPERAEWNQKNLKEVQKLIGTINSKKI